jgi:UDP-2,3-diacylglucosamine hydrolase
MAKPRNSLWFVSDLHLETSLPERSFLFESFLKELIEKKKADVSSVTHLLLCGDIFDLWVGGNIFFYHKFKTVVDPILELAQLGVNVIYIEGNHDVQISAFWEPRGVRVCRQAVELEFSAAKSELEESFNEVYRELPLSAWSPSSDLSAVKKAYVQKASAQRFTLRVEHGDYINPFDRTYLNYLEIIRKRRMKYLAALIPARVWNYLGEQASQISKKKSRSPERARDREPRLTLLHEQFAMARFKERPFDLLVSGHIHLCLHIRLASGAQAINLGSWLEPEPRALLVELGSDCSAKIYFKHLKYSGEKLSSHLKRLER